MKQGTKQAVTVAEIVSPEPRTLGDAIAINAAANPQAPAIVFPRITLTYETLLRQVEQLGSELRCAGIGASNPVAVALPDEPDLAVAIVAISCFAPVVPLNPKLTRAETEDLFAEHRIDALVLPNGSGIPAREVAVRHGALLFEASYNDGDALTLRASSGERAAEDIVVEPDNTAIILRTSGTTGRPKLVPVTHKNLLAMAERLQDWFDLGPNDRSLCVLPLYYAQGLKNTLFVPLILGGSVACPSRLPGADFFEWLAELKPTWYSGGPTIHHSVLDASEARRGTNFSHSLRFIHTAAAPLPDTVHNRLESLFGVPVIDSYGLSEAGLVASNSIAPQKRKRGTVGKFRRGELAIRTEDGRIADIGGPGEIVLRGPGVTPGYIDNSEGNQAAFTNGWFNTGDIGRIDADGFLTLCGRIKELINRGGEKVSPAEIDAALLRHPAVVEVAAFGVPHPRLGEDVAAAVVFQPGAVVTPQELRQFLLPRFAAFKLPRRIHQVASLPKGPTGKIHRQELSQLFGTRPAEHPAVEWSSPLEIEIAEIWQRLLGCKSIGPEDDFFELGGDSLLATQMLLEVEQLTGRVLPETMLFENATIRQLAENVVSKDAAGHQGMLLKIQHGTSVPPFIFVDGDFAGGGYYVRNFARLMGPQWPFFSLRCHGLEGDRLQSIKQMAQDYKQLLDAAGIKGPYRLGGHCNGALIALELARQLEADGREVELVAMIEPISLNARSRFRAVARALQLVFGLVGCDKNVGQARLGSAMSWVWRNVPLNISQSRISLVEAVIWWTALCKTSLLSCLGRLPMTHDYIATAFKIGKENRSVPERLSKTTVAFYKCMASYIPESVLAPVLCVVSDSSAQDPKYSAEVWNKLTPRIEMATVPGDHLTCITTQAEALASLLREYLVAIN